MKDLLVGLESSFDVWVTLKSTEALLELSKMTESGLNEELRLAYEGLKDNAGDELPIDGSDLKRLIDELKCCSNMETSIGGGAAIESSQFISLGSKAYFLGNYFPHQIKGTVFSRSDFSQAQPSDLSPKSIVLQFSGVRFILSNGQGRRIGNLIDYIEKLPRTIEHSQKADAISLVGWHAIFALGANRDEIDMVVSSLNSIRKQDSLMFTDTGGFGKMNDSEIKRLWEIYEMFDILALNEKEFSRLSKVLSLQGTENERLRKLMTSGQNIKTVWLHTRDYQKSISYSFAKDRLALAQEFASAAGCLRVETGGFSSVDEIEKRSTPGRSSASGEMVKTVCLKNRSFRTEVGAGDVSSASFLWRLLG